MQCCESGWRLHLGSRGAVEAKGPQRALVTAPSECWSHGAATLCKSLGLHLKIKKRTGEREVEIVSTDNSFQKVCSRAETTGEWSRAFFFFLSIVF